MFERQKTSPALFKCGGGDNHHLKKEKTPQSSAEGAKIRPNLNNILFSCLILSVSLNDPMLIMELMK